MIFLPKRRLVLLWATLATSSSQTMTQSRWKKIVTSFYRSLLFFWHHSENWVFLKTVSFHFQSIKWAWTLQWCKTLAWKISHTCSLGAIFENILLSGNGFWLVYEDLSIDFGRPNFLQNRDMACKLGCGLFLSPQKTVSPSSLLAVWFLFAITANDRL